MLCGPMSGTSTRCICEEAAYGAQRSGPPPRSGAAPRWDEPSMSALAPDVPLHAISGTVARPRPSRAGTRDWHYAMSLCLPPHEAPGDRPGATEGSPGRTGSARPPPPFVARSAHHVPLHARPDG